MDTRIRYFGMMTVAALAILFTAGVAATPVTMDFDGLNPDGEYVADYYNGGCGNSFLGSDMTCGGPDYGVVWEGATVALGGVSAGNPPSRPNVIRQIGFAPMIMNVADGFDGGFSFYYSAPILGGWVGIYSGLGGSGTLLASTGSLAGTPLFCEEGFGPYACWNLVDGPVFSGLAHSVVFGGFPALAAYDNVSFDMRDAPVGVPEPGAFGMFALGILLLGLAAGLRRRRWC